MASPNYVKAGYWYCNNKFPTPVASIPSQHFTHLFAAFADVDATTGDVTFPVKYQVQFSTFTQAVQKKNEHVQTLLSIGGEVSPPTFASLIGDANKRESFIKSSLSLARSNNFHGLSLHWLYHSSQEEMINFGSLLREWRRAVDLESKWTGNDPLLLVAAVYFKPKYSSGFDYPVDDIKKSLSWINVLAYDYYSPSSSQAIIRPFAALYNEKDKANCGDTGVSDWLKYMPPEQIVLGLPFYGYAWRLKDANQITGIFARADGPDKDVPPNVAAAQGVAADGDYSKSSDGTIFYNQIQYFIELKKPKVEQYSEKDYVMDCCSAGRTWIGYNDTGSIRAKVEYAKKIKGLLGYYAWHVGCDQNGTLSGAASDEWDKP